MPAAGGSGGISWLASKGMMITGSRIRCDRATVASSTRRSRSGFQNASVRSSRPSCHRDTRRPKLISRSSSACRQRRGARENSSSTWSGSMLASVASSPGMPPRVKVTSMSVVSSDSIIRNIASVRSEATTTGIRSSHTVTTAPPTLRMRTSSGIPASRSGSGVKGMTTARESASGGPGRAISGTITKSSC